MTSFIDCFEIHIITFDERCERCFYWYDSKTDTTPNISRSVQILIRSDELLLIFLFHKLFKLSLRFEAQVCFAFALLFSVFLFYIIQSTTLLPYRKLLVVRLIGWFTLPVQSLCRLRGAELTLPNHSWLDENRFYGASDLFGVAKLSRRISPHTAQRSNVTWLMWKTLK